MGWLHDWPPPLGAGVVILCFLVPALAGSIYLQPLIVRMVQRERDPNYPVGLLLNSFTIYYGVLLALLSIAVFENRRIAEDAIQREASSLVTLYRDMLGYPEAQRLPVIELLRRFVEVETVPDVWRAQFETGFTRPGTEIVDEINRKLLALRADGGRGDDGLYRETLRRFNDFIERHRDRIQAGGTRIPSIIWYVVLVGAALNVFVLWLFDLGRAAHLILGGVLTFFIGMVIYMVAVLDQPFRGANGLRPDNLLYARHQMRPL